jgi:hypothetical protein
MRRHFVRFLVPLLAGALIVLAAKVTTDYSHTADFSHYSTYSWLDVKAGDPLWPDRIMSLAGILCELDARAVTQEIGRIRCR